MRTLRSLASSLRSSERRSADLGSVNWAFIITLFLLLGFIFMWYGASDDRDTLKGERDKLATDNVALRRAGQDLGTKLAEVSGLVGLDTDTANFESNSYRVTDTKKLAAHLAENGELDWVNPSDPQAAPTKVPGFYNVLMNKLVVTYTKSARAAQTDNRPAGTTVALKWVTQKFKDKLTANANLLAAIPAVPVKPQDDGDEAAQAKYREDLERYTKAVADYQAAMDELKGPTYAAEWREWSKLVGGPLAIANPKELDEPVTVNFKPDVAVRPTKLVDLLPLAEPAFQKMAAEIKANKEAELKLVAKLVGELAASNKSIEDGKKSFEDVRKALTEELATTKETLGKETKRATEQETAARKAEKERKDAVTAAQSAEVKAKSDITALQQAVNSNKEERDLAIRRDEKDGTLLAVSNDMATGTIDLGSADKVFAGLKFNVSFVDRGGARVTVGEVQVTKVTGAHSSQVRVLSQTTTLTGGLILSNPLYQANKTIHIFVVGFDLEFTQRRLLEQMNVVVDAQPSGATDYYVVPDDWTGGMATPVEGEEDGGAPKASKLDLARQEAFRFGATVVTRRMLESFLKL